MPSHIHTDVVSILFIAFGVELVFHIQRMIGALIASKASPKLGTVVGGLATFG